MRRIAIIVLFSTVAFLQPGNPVDPCDVVARETNDEQGPSIGASRRAHPTMQVLDATRVHDAGNIRLLVTNWGQVGSQPGSGAPWSDQPSAEWPAGSNAEYLWAGGLWIGALKNLQPRVTTAVPELEFRPGLSELDRVYAASEGQAGGRREPFPNADDDSDGAIDEDWLDGRDNDGDGRIDEDFAAVSTQMFSAEYRDTDPNIKLAYPEHEPLGLLVRQSSMTWEDRLLDDFIAFDFRLVNEGFDALTDVYVGFFADCDIGRRGDAQAAEDDMSGFWEGIVRAKLGLQFKNVKVSIGYMFDEDTDQGSSAGYIGLMFLGAQEPHARRDHPYVSLANYRYFSGAVPYESGGDPTNDAERYAVLNGTSPRSLPAPDPLTGLVRPDVTATPDDYRMLVSVGPFSVVESGETLGVQGALVLGQGFNGMMNNAVLAQLTFDGAYVDRDKDPTTGVAGRETAVCVSDATPRGSAFPIAASWPYGVNPAHHIGLVEWCDSHAHCWGTSPANPDCWATITDDCEYINADCKLEEQTGFMTGVEGKEYRLKWWWGAVTPVALSAFTGQANGAHIELAWRLSSEDASRLREVGVERASESSGAYRRIVTLEPDQSMTYLDTGVEQGHSYWYRLSLYARDGSVVRSQPIEVATRGVRLRTTLDVPHQIEAGAIEIRYRVGAVGSVRLDVFDIAGRRVKTLIDQTQGPGSYRRLWDRVDASGIRASRGIYVVRLSATNATLSRKVVLVR